MRRSLGITIAAALALTACSGPAASNVTSTPPSGLAPTSVEATSSASPQPSSVADLVRTAELVAEAAAFTTIGAVSINSEQAVAIQGYTATGAAMWAAQPGTEPMHVGGAEMASKLMPDVTITVEDADFATVVERLADVPASCSHATVLADVLPGGQWWSRITCTDTYLVDSTKINDTAFPEALPITSAAEWDAAVALLRPLLDGDPTHLRAVSQGNVTPFQLTGGSHTRVDNMQCWDTVSLPTVVNDNQRESNVYGCTTVKPVFESWGSTDEPLPLDKLNGAFFEAAQKEILASRDLDPTKRFHIDYYLVSDTELGYQVTHDDGRISGTRALP